MEARRKRIPIVRRAARKNRGCGRDELISACAEYGNKTKRRVTFEYALIKGVNDETDHARELAARLKKTLSHVNLIPVNQGPDRDFAPSSPRTTEGFKNILEEHGIKATVRRGLGSGVNAACGQLKHSVMKGIQK